MKTKPLFRKLFFLGCFLLIASFSKAQFVNIPDANFRSWLLFEGYVSCLSADSLSLDTTCIAVLNTGSIDFVGWGISELTGIQYFRNLHRLDCYENQLTSLPVLPDSLGYLDCSQNQITSLPTLPSTLTTFICTLNSLSSFPNLPASLTNLTCASNQLTSLPTLPSTLTHLDFAYNNITSLPNMPPLLSYLNCSSNTLVPFPTLPASLTTLYCSTCQLASLPVLPSSLINLDCSSNQINSLAGLPASLLYLDCSSNQLTSLTGLPVLLAYINCSSNQLTSLISFTASLDHLDCSSNLLTSLPVLPVALSQLHCEYNQLTSLPLLPGTLRELTCNNNQLTSLPDFPGIMDYVNISSNPISCLPEIKTILALVWDNTNISCIPNLDGIVNDVNDLIQYLPLCQPSSGCPIYWNISGKVFFDPNGNCIQDTNEINLHYVQVVLDSVGIQTQVFLTDQLGEYAFRAGPGNYTIYIDTTNEPYQVICPGSSFQTAILTVANPLDSLLDFGLECKPGFDLIARGISPMWPSFRPGSDVILNLNVSEAMRFYGPSCATGLSGSVQVILNGSLSYLSPESGALVPDSVIGNTITWNVSDFSLIDPYSSFNIIVHIDTGAAIGDTICIQLSVLPVAGDNIPTNNFLSACYFVSNSLDPNEKFMSPSGLVDMSEQWFTFTVFFQNTGNADAENIYILDTLDQNLDATTFTYLSSSHDAVTQLLPGNILRFNYHDIFLSDSTTNEPASHGYVQYKIKRKQSLLPGTTIYNTAYIYFDFNAPIVTNQTSATFISITSVSESIVPTFELFPNPVRDELSVISYSSNGKKISLEIVNVLGQTVYSLQSAITNPQFAIKIDVSHFQQGIYFVKVRNEQGSSVKRFVKE